ncbi:MAG: type II 3-dehydroquinate dehydratase [Bacteroidetes bacterium]|nr:type II 3-dehydroquinate dehydratase [Bacteroidota bacterium]MDA1332745.1 type II 3-dehydroquinate dehydratase [Bacteroidota bacterium]
MRILILNGPNLNMLGVREPDVYGSETLKDLQLALSNRFSDVSFSFAQSNHEGELIDALQQANADGIVLNGAGFTHTSVALRDAIASISIPVVEVHISNIAAREDFRHHSLTAGVCVGAISGLGIEGYHLAVQYFVSRRTD